MLPLSAKCSRPPIRWEKTHYERGFGETLKGPVIPIGSMVENYPISATDQSRLHQCGKKGLLGMFLGYALYAGRIWTRQKSMLEDSIQRKCPRPKMVKH